MKTSFSRRNLLISLLFLLALIVLLAYFVDWQTVAEQLRQANRFYLAAAILLLLIGYLAYAVRWRLLLNNQPAFNTTFHAANAGNMVNTLLPLRPGDAARIFMLGTQKDLSAMQVTSSIIVERWFEQIMRLAAFGGAIMFGASGTVSIQTILGSILFLTGSLLSMIWMIRKRDSALEKLPPRLAYLPRINEEKARNGLANLINGLSTMTSLRSIFVALVWSVITWALFWGFHALCLLALNQDIPTAAMLAMSLGSLALVPPSATTLPGIYQVSMVIPLSLVGYNENLLTSYALVMNVIEMLIVNGLGIWGSMHSNISLRQLFSK